MNIFNRIVPWFIPTKDDQRKWYKDELLTIPKEEREILRDFMELSEQYNRALGDFEAELTKTPLYEKYLHVKSMAQQTSFLWNRLEYKREREKTLQEYLKNL